MCGKLSDCIPDGFAPVDNHLRRCGALLSGVSSLVEEPLFLLSRYLRGGLGAHPNK
jgi:hypothetical protein